MVLTHALLSADGRLEGFPPELGLYYELAARLPHDAILSGSGTMVAAARAAGLDLSVDDEPPGAPDPPLADASLPLHTVRVDAGPGLNTALLGAGLLDEISVLVAPYLVGRGRTLFEALPGPDATQLTLISAESQPNSHVWLRYSVAHA